MTRRLIGIAGAPGAGKSTFAAAERDRLEAAGVRAVVLGMDGFHFPQAELTRLGRRDRMGAPDTFDVDAFVATLSVLREPGAVRAPVFDRTVEEPVRDALVVPEDVTTVLVEGNYLLLNHGGWKRVAPLLDTVIFLSLDNTVRRERLIARHIEFGKTPAAAAEWVERVDQPNARLVAATASRADRIVTAPVS